MNSILTGLFLFLSSTVIAAEKPNLVLLFIDDMGYGDIGPFGSTLNRTPNLDRMAAEGMKLTSFYAAPVCSASRAQLLTGSYAPRVSVPGVFFPAGPKGLNPKEHTVADYLGELGYATMCVGKWHLGDQREFLPTNNGFDGYFGVPYSNDMGRTSSETGKKVHPLMRDTEPAELIEDEAQRRLVREYTEEGIRFIRKNREKPFFLYLPHTAMHVPLYPHPDFVGRSANGTYGDWVEELDWSVGQILDAIREEKLERKTLVLFTSDNGPWASKGKAGGISGPLRGSKGGTLEGGVRGPTIAWWPGTVSAGSSVDAVSGTIDVLPTFVSLAGGKVKQEIKIDGKDLAPILRGDSTESPHEAWYYYQGTRLQAVRSGPWKLALTSQSLGMGIKEKPEDLQKAGRLYHLDDEIGEVTDRAAENPEVVARLTTLADAMRADIGDGKPGPGVRPPGEVENPVTLYPSVARNRKPAKASVKTKPIAWNQVKKGDVFAPTNSPSVHGKDFKIEATISGQDRTGVVIAHGGSAVGYSLYTKQNRVVFAVRTSGDEIVRVSETLPDSGVVKLLAVGKSGQIELRVGDQKVVTQQGKGRLDRHPQEEFCVGVDSANPVDPQSPLGSFKGTIESVKVSSGE